MTIIDGKSLSELVDQETAMEAKRLLTQNIIPHLVVILVGNDPSSEIYVNNKNLRAEKLGIKSRIIKLSSKVSELELLNQIDALNEDKNVHAILVQMPLPKHINVNNVIKRIVSNKDVDGFNPINMGSLFSNTEDNIPVACTPKGIMRMLSHYKIEVTGKHVVIVGRSNIVGRPLAALFLNANATVTITHSYTEKLSDITKTADILVSAIGKPNFITSKYVKEHATVIDVGINRNSEKKLTGDVDFDNVIGKVDYITPVPKGVGPMTISMLMEQTVQLAKWSMNSDG